MTQMANLDTARIMVDFNQMKTFGQDPLILESGGGIRVTDVFGKTYIDGISGIFTVNMGHGVKEITRAAFDQMEKISFTAPTMATNPQALALADLLISLTPPQYNTVKFFSGGSEANEAAFRMARQYFSQTGHPKKHKIIARYKSYHGSTGNALGATAQPDWKWQYEPLAPGFLHVTPPNRPACSACRSSDACTLGCVEAIEEAIVNEHPETVAAVIAEPVMMSAGVHVPHPDYFPRLREICDRYNVLLIFDEIITGFGRTGTLFAAEHVGAWPDILTCGKGISGGYAPLSAILITDRVARPFWGEESDSVQFWAGHTYGGNPVACAVGAAAVRYLLDHRLIENGNAIGRHLTSKLQAFASEHPIVRDIRSAGLLIAVELSQPIGRAVQRNCRKNGLLVRPAGDFIVLAPPLCCTIDEADEVIEIIVESIAGAVAA